MEAPSARASLINRLPKLRMLGMTGARNASLDTPACTARGIVVCNTVGGNNNEAATAELALGLLISAARAIPAGDANIRGGRFQEGVPVGYALAGNESACFQALDESARLFEQSAPERRRELREAELRQLRRSA